MIEIFRFLLHQRLGGPNEDSNLSADLSVAAGSPRTDTRSIIVSPKSVEVVSNNNDSPSESHTPPLPETLKLSPQATKKRKSRFADAPPDHDLEKQEETGNNVDKTKTVDDKQTTKKANEWDMFAEADNIGDFNVCY